MSEKICVIGAGYIGSVIASVLASKGCNVTAIDINQKLIDGFNTGDIQIAEPGLAELVAEGRESGLLTFTTDFDAVTEASILLVTVGTPLAEDYTADLSHVQATADTLSKYVQDGQMIMLKSTVPPGTTREIFANRLGAERKLHFAFSPERLAEGAAIRELTSLPIIVGGLDEASGERAQKFWQDKLGVEVIRVSSPESAEMVKLADNLWIDLNIALAHDLAKLCDALPYPLDAIEVIKGANSLKKGQHYVNILTPSNGVGGYCLTKDPWFVDALGKRHGAELLTPKTSRDVNDSMPGYCADQIVEHLKSVDGGIANAKVAVMGLAFKTNSGDVRLTPVIPFLKELRDAGVENLVIHDPMVLTHEADELGETLEPSMDAALKDADCVAFLVGHDQFANVSAQTLGTLTNPGCMVFDGRLYLDRDVIKELAEQGLKYKGVGR